MANLLADLGTDLQAAFIEFIGTTFFLTLAFGSVQAVVSEAASSPTPGVDSTLYISTAFGLALLVSAWIFYRATGALFNPNVALGLFLCRVIGPVRFVLFCIAQLLGGIAAAALVHGLTPGPVAFNTTLGQGVNVAQGLFIEMFITFALVLAVLMLAAEKHYTTPFAPIGVGLTLFAGELFGVHYTGGAMNTARSFGPAVISGFPSGEHWVYWVGPGLGSILAAAFYQILRVIRYWKLAPDQDAREPEKSPTTPAEQKVRSRSQDDADRRDENGVSDATRSQAPSRHRANDSAV